MTHTLKNLSRRLVSFRGNSGQNWHLPPGVSLDIAGVEISGNSKIKKLTEQHVIAVTSGVREKPETRGKRGEDVDAGEGTGSKERSRRGR